MKILNLTLSSPDKNRNRCVTKWYFFLTKKEQPADEPFSSYKNPL
mgnify:CR=1